jgi:hypothetical protein
MFIAALQSQGGKKGGYVRLELVIRRTQEQMTYAPGIVSSSSVLNATKPSHFFAHVSFVA